LYVSLEAYVTIHSTTDSTTNDEVH
jgi:hypothetical protein